MDTPEQYYVKTCRKCGRTKSMDDFYYREEAYDKCESHCKTCRQRYQKYPRRYNSYSYKHKYGITIEQKEELIEQQKGCCYLCDNVLPTDTRQQHVEHDELSGQIFGIACQKCNHGIANFNHDPYLMVKVAKRMLRLRIVGDKL